MKAICSGGMLQRLPKNNCYSMLNKNMNQPGAISKSFGGNYYLSRSQSVTNAHEQMQMLPMLGV